MQDPQTLEAPSETGSGRAIDEGGGPSASLRAYRQVVDRLAGRVDALAKEISDIYCALSDRPGREPIDSFRTSEVATEQLVHLLRAVSMPEASTADRTELAALGALVAELATAGYPLGELLDVTSATWQLVWRVVHEEVAERPGPFSSAAAALVGEALLSAMARSALVVSEAYASVVGSQLESWPPSVLGQVLRGQDDLARMGQGPDVAGWPTTTDHTVMVVTWRRGIDDTADGGVIVELLEAFTGQGAHHRILVGEHEGMVVVAVAGTDGGTATCLELWEDVLAHVRLPHGWRPLGGIGLTETGLAGIRRSYDQARRALAVASAARGTGTIVSYASALPELLLLENPNLAEDLHRVALGPLEMQFGDRDSVLTDLETYLDSGLNTMAAAKKLHVHRHTLTGRLEKVEQLTGLRLDDGGQRLLLELALRAKRLLWR